MLCSFVTRALPRAGCSSSARAGAFRRSALRAVRREYHHGDAWRIASFAVAARNENSGWPRYCGEEILHQAFVRGPTEPPLLEQTIGENFANIVWHYGDRPAVISTHQQQQYTYNDLDVKSNSLARGLRSVGVGKGDRVGVLLGNSVEFATVTYALFKLGAILVPLNPAFTTPQVQSALNHLASSHLIVSAETKLTRKPPRSNIPLIKSLIPDLQSSRHIIQSESVPSLEGVTVVDNSEGRIDVKDIRAVHRYELLLGTARPNEEGRALSDQRLKNYEPVNIQFTSGTTSMPKAATLTHRNILNNGKFIGDRMLLTHEDIVVCPPPLFHCFGCILGYMATATHGSAIVFPSEAFNAQASLAAVRDYKATALYGVPTMFIEELDLIKHGHFDMPPHGFPHLRTGIAAGSSIPAELMRKLHKTLNLTELTICYGMTETSPVSAMTTTDDPIDKRIDSVGRVLPHVWTKVVDPDDWNRVLDVGERGEIAVSGYLVMNGYWGDEQKTADVLRADADGVVWMHTGDEGTIDSEGYVRITGRIKDLIIRGGENIHPLEIENCLLAHNDVTEVSVVGLPDERYGEAVAAFVVRNDEREVSADELREWVKTHLSHQLVPKYVFWVADYPKTASGKIQKFKLRDLGVELLREGKGDIKKK
ncbi:acyl-CoA synthetase/AMP-acid ligase-like protein II [Rhizodiscina lignyota]|uniref:Acyl-CoA synthetase/AMP-acid ligase-like protein II n=1 Tax=Rhizodiscina lignyota TaxID=1504668 RepID=A0A9P4IP19_9PEZI|nr:acyl-CoA synthetase/AMP-acid ligase-like protein II [Rhizodiscina lignyota]